MFMNIVLFSLLCTISHVCCAAEQLTKNLIIQYPGGRESVIPIPEQSEERKSRLNLPTQFDIETTLPFDKEVERKLHVLIKGEDSLEHLLESIKGAQRQKNFFTLGKESGVISPSIIVIKIERGTLPSTLPPWYRSIDTQVVDKNLFALLENVDLGNEFFPVHFLDIIDYGSTVGLDYLLKVFAYFKYENAKAIGNSLIPEVNMLEKAEIKIKKIYSDLSADQIQQSLLWSEVFNLQSSIQTIFKDIFVDLYSSTLLKTDFTKIAPDRLRYYLPLTVDIDKAATKKLMEWFLVTVFPIEKRFNLSFNNSYLFTNPYPSKVIMSLYEHKPALFVNCGIRTELQYMQGKRIWYPAFGSDTLNALVMDLNNNIVTIDNEGIIALLHAHDNNANFHITLLDPLSAKNLIKTTSSTSEVSEENLHIDIAALILLPNKNIGIGYGNTFYEIRIDNNTPTAISHIKISDDKTAQITYISMFGDLMAITYTIAGEYFYTYYKIMGNVFTKVEPPQNAIEMMLDFKYNPMDDETKRIFQKRMLLVPKEQYKDITNTIHDEFLQTIDILKIRGFTQMHNCYDFVVDLDHKKIYSAMSTKEDFVSYGNSFGFKLREYNFIPQEIQGFCTQLNKRAQQIDQDRDNKKSFEVSKSLTLDILYYMYKEYGSHVLQLKMQENIVEYVSKKIKKTIPVSMQNRIYAYLRKKYFELGGHTRGYISESAVQASTALLSMAFMTGVFYKAGMLPSIKLPK